MSAMRIRHKKLSCVLTVRERSLLKETKEVRERNLALLKELKETKNKLYAFQQEMRQKGRCGMLSMENVWYREAIDKKNIELEAVKEKLCEKQKTLRRVLRMHDEREEELEVTVDELKMTKKTLCDWTNLPKAVDTDDKGFLFLWMVLTNFFFIVFTNGGRQEVSCCFSKTGRT
jgi:dynactin complex subunit